ncbi:hypothetical protein [Paraburkholderia sacchari]|uniref:hypothetical protein n=1 Tax=Paraburkholderia sacchari TaxID=159450 RepID=UPI001BCF1A0D|nr:hypothetical protein [Paraburkholderia sacchari]
MSLYFKFVWPHLLPDEKVEQRGIYDEELKADFLLALERQRHVDISSPDKIANSRLLKKCTAALLSEMPSSAFSVPET